MRVLIPNFENKKDLFSYLKENKDTIEAKKKLSIIHSDVFSGSVQKTVFSGNAPVEEDVDTLRVKVVCNTANFIDSHMDMIIPGAATKSINERKFLIPHLHDHIHTTEAEIAKVVDIYPQNISLSELGLNKVGLTESIIMISDVKKSMNEKAFERYKEGRALQHSIGLQYVKLDLAINDEESEKEYDFWNKYISQAINPEVAQERGYFWVVQEYKLIENSVVLFGSNSLTPTLENNMKTEPGLSTQQNEPDRSSTLDKLIEDFKL